MKKIVLLFIGLISTVNICANNEVIGKWICHKISYQNGQDLEINHPFYSSFISYEFDSKEVFISTNYKEKGQPNKYIVSGSTIQIGFRRFSFTFKDKFLILNEDGDELQYYFLRKKDFLKENKLYKENFFLKDNDTIYNQSFYLNPEFKYNQSFSNYLRKSIPNYSNSSIQRHQFKGNFVLNRDNKISQVNIERGVNKIFDKGFVKAVLKSQRHWNNTTGKSILIEQKFNFFEHGKYFVTKENWEFHKHAKKGDSYYNDSDFQLAINAYEKACEVKIIENEFTEIMKRNMLKKLGISYLAINDIDQACSKFKMVGSTYEFSVRTFILNFCE